MCSTFVKTSGKLSQHVRVRHVRGGGDSALIRFGQADRTATVSVILLVKLFIAREVDGNCYKYNACAMWAVAADHERSGHKSHNQ